MIRFSLFSFLCLLLFCCSHGLAEQQGPISPTVARLERENATLQRQVKRLETQVSALREELNSPDVTQIIAGIGYIVGIFGIAGWLAARKKTSQGN